jgi:hypothetical protein
MKPPYGDSRFGISIGLSIEFIEKLSAKYYHMNLTVIHKCKLSKLF